MAKKNREYKDSVFVDLFYSDETAMANLLSLYNALHGTDLEDESLVQKVKIENVLYIRIRNDLAVLIDSAALELMEHQSTVNPNIPLRMLLYVARVYEQLTEAKARYKTALMKIPAPEFYLFYNGRQDYPLEQELRLSDAFIKTTTENSMELKVTAININSDKSHTLLSKCKVLREYSLFIDTVRKYEKDDDGMEQAICECIKNNILAEYLKRKDSEVMNMLLGEYDYETDIQVKQEEAREDERAQIVENFLRLGSVSDEDIMKASGVSFNQLEEIKIAMGNK